MKIAIQGTEASFHHQAAMKFIREPFEIIECDSDLQRLIVANPSREELDSYVRRRGTRTLQRDGIDRAVEGATTVEEVLRVVSA